MSLVAFYMFLINVIRFNPLFNLALSNLHWRKLDSTTKISLARGIWEMRLAQVELRSREKNVQLQLVKKWPESASPNALAQAWRSSLGPRRPNFVSRSNFFIRYRSRACGIKTRHVATGTAGFITNATARTVCSRELCKLRIFRDWVVCIALKVSYSNFCKSLSSRPPFFFLFLYNNFYELKSWHIFMS